jgi:hypothetical protein
MGLFLAQLTVWLKAVYFKHGTRQSEDLASYSANPQGQEGVCTVTPSRTFIHLMEPRTERKDQAHQWEVLPLTWAK